MDFNYVKVNYNVPACYGRKVVVNGRPGIIVEDQGHHIGVNFDEDKPGVIYPVHPTWKCVYGDIGKVRSMTRSQARYRHYLNVADCYESFHEYLKDCG